ncbi:uncharacterized protein LOC111363780 [Spodoptera litura]|uniref:Uncharacterized protein LOC111363780 n=1 Tax=Spodoptera litura TaxID=69820 RepID=A0A9J7ERC2_SPOLT|nr:uncharacterized protein LOC111363780 [Spodoptera litura]
MVYNLTYDNWWEAKIQIDETEEAQKWVKESVEFFSNWENNVEDNDGDYNKAFLRNLFPHLIEESINNSLQGVIWKITDNYEGFPNLDGTDGITLLEIDSFSFDRDDLDIEISK